MQKKVIAVSGGFDPIHIGHIRMFKEASKLGHLYVILNSDDFLKKKKGYVFMPYEERKEIIKSIKYVRNVVDCVDKDMSVCKTLDILSPNIFCNGGDRKCEDDLLEKDICKKLNIQMLFNVGGEKISSSSELVKKMDEKKI